MLHKSVQKGEQTLYFLQIGLTLSVYAEICFCLQIGHTFNAQLRFTQEHTAATDVINKR